jgi:hypothetical protein
MRTAVITAKDVCLRLTVENGKGALTIEAAGNSNCELPCSLPNLFAVSKDLRYYVVGDGVSCMLERQGDVISVTLNRAGRTETYAVPAIEFERAVQNLSTTGIRANCRAYLS